MRAERASKRMNSPAGVGVGSSTGAPTLRRSTVLRVSWLTTCTSIAACATPCTARASTQALSLDGWKRDDGFTAGSRGCKDWCSHGRQPPLQTRCGSGARAVASRDAPLKGEMPAVSI
jgi:hypothetical protein